MNLSDELIETVLDRIQEDPLFRSKLYQIIQEKFTENLKTQIQFAQDKILSLENNWDGEGSKKYKQEIFLKIMKFLEELYGNLFESSMQIDIPRILPSSNGSVDIHWKENKFDLLINFQEDSELAYISGDNYSELKIEAEININNLTKVILPWLEILIK